MNQVRQAEKASERTGAVEERIRPTVVATIVVRVVDDGVLLALVGDLDARSTAEVRDELNAALAGHERVVVDLSGVENVDLVALRVLAVASRRAARAGHHLVVVGPRPCVRRVMHLSHLARLLEVEPAGPARVPA